MIGCTLLQSCNRLLAVPLDGGRKSQQDFVDLAVFAHVVKGGVKPDNSAEYR
jgi:hypothetical protein